MFRRVTALFLVAAMLMTSFTRFFIYAGFELNQEYIAKTLCVNRDKPELHCNGKCYLSNKIKQAEEKEKRTERENQRKSFQEAAFEVKKFEPLPPVWLLQARFAVHRTSDLPQGVSEILHPPPRLLGNGEWGMES